VSNRRSETETYGEVGAEAEPVDPSAANGSTRKSAKRQESDDKNLLLSSDDEFQ
jgi:hypothetical protein